MKIKKLLFLFAFSFVFIAPFSFVFSDYISSIKTGSVFNTLRKKIIGMHFDGSIWDYSSEEQAVIILSKAAAYEEHSNFIINKLPKEFLVTAVKEGGPRAVSILVGTSPIEMIISEIKSECFEYISDYLKKGEIRVASGKIPFSYANINNNRVPEIFYYFISIDKENNLSVTIYTNKPVFAPLSNIKNGYQGNYEWKDDDFKGEKLKPFSINFSGKAEEKKRTMGFVEKPTINIAFYDSNEMFSPDEIERKMEKYEAPSVWEEAMETAINVGGFFVEKTGEAADLVGDGWKKTKDFIGGAFGGFSGVNSYGERSGVVIDLNDINRNYSSDFTQPEEKVDDKVDDGREESVEGETTETEKETEVEKEEQQQYQEESIVSVELNSAIGEDLELLSGIGPVYAERIIGNRPFCSLDDLTKVPGIGEATLRNIKEQGLAYVSPVEICFQEEETEEEDEEEEVDEDVLEKFEEIKRRIERLREKVDEKTGSEEKQEEEIEEEEEKDEEEQEENEKQFSGCKDGQINLNYADKEILQEIVGIGSGYAQQIIELREEEPFWTLECLDRVNGIALGGSRLNKIIEEDLACAADKNDDSFDHFEKEKKSSSGGGGGGGSSPPPDDSDDEDEDGGENDEDEDEEEEEEEDEKEIILTHLSEIKHGDEEGIEVKIEILNFENTLYDVKVAIEADGDLYFSEIYNNEEGWKSAFNYLKTMQGPSEEKTFRLRIKDGKDYEGTGKIVAKIRKDGSIVKEEESAIEILKKEESGNDENDDEGSNDEEGGGDDNEGDEEEKDPIEFEIVITGAETIWNAGLFSEDIDASDANIGKYTEAIVSKAEYVVQNEMKSGNIDASDAEAGDYTEAIVSRAGYLWQNLLIKEEFCYDQ